MKRIFKYTIGVVILLAFAACTKEETPIFQEEARVLSITVTDGGYASAFTEDDACGLYVARGTQTLYSNVKLTAERDAATGDLVWKSKDNTTLVGGLSDEHYYLYYPY